MKLLDTRAKLKKAIMGWYKIERFENDPYHSYYTKNWRTAKYISVTYKSGRGNGIYTHLYEAEIWGTND